MGRGPLGPEGAAWLPGRPRSVPAAAPCPDRLRVRQRGGFKSRTSACVPLSLSRRVLRETPVGRADRRKLLVLKRMLLWG